MIPPSILAPDGVTVASSWFDTLWIWNVNHPDSINRLLGHTKEITRKIFSPNGRLLATGSSDGMVLLWDMSPYVDDPTHIQSPPVLPKQAELRSNYPNPFNLQT